MISADLLAEFQRPFGLGPLIEVDTTGLVKHEAVAAAVQSAVNVAQARSEGRAAVPNGPTSAETIVKPSPRAFRGTAWGPVMTTLRADGTYSSSSSRNPTFIVAWKWPIVSSVKWPRMSVTSNQSR